jgi:hypothetical protein
MHFGSVIGFLAGAALAGGSAIGVASLSSTSGPAGPPGPPGAPGVMGPPGLSRGGGGGGPSGVSDGDGYGQLLAAATYGVSVDGCGLSEVKFVRVDSGGSTASLLPLLTECVGYTYPGFMVFDDGYFAYVPLEIPGESSYYTPNLTNGSSVAYLESAEANPRRAELRCSVYAWQTMRAVFPNSYESGVNVPYLACQIPPFTQKVGSDFEVVANELLAAELVSPPVLIYVPR